jgi:hypothetical protein
VKENEMGKWISRSVVAYLGMFVAAASVARAEQVDNPAYQSWAKQKVGTTVTHENTSAVAGQEFKSEMVQKLVELTKDKAVVETTMKLNIPGAPAPMPQKVVLPAKVDEAEAKPNKMPPGTTGEMKEQGSEKVQIAGKSYNCKVFTMVGEASGAKMSGKTWMSEEVPGRLVKSETTADAQGQKVKSSMALTKIEAK